MKVRISYLGSEDFEADLVSFATEQGIDGYELAEMVSHLCDGFEWTGSTPEGEYFSALRIG